MNQMYDNGWIYTNGRFGMEDLEQQGYVTGLECIIKTPIGFERAICYFDNKHGLYYGGNLNKDNCWHFGCHQASIGNLLRIPSNYTVLAYRPLDEVDYDGILSSYNLNEMSNKQND